MKRNLAFVLVALALSLQGGRADDKERRGAGARDSDERVAQLMRQKLRHSQRILEGLALGDFGKIADNAGELVQISKQAEWLVLKTPKYEMYSNDFRRSAESLAGNAKDKNLDAAALSYVELTLNCVHCHKYTREVRHGRLDLNAPRELRADAGK